MRSLQLRKILVSIMVVLVTTVAIGCTENKVSQQENPDIVVDNSNKEDSTVDSEDKEATNEVIESIEDNKEKVELILYSKDVNTEEQIILKKVEVDKNSSIEDKLKTLANELSKNAFDNLNILRAYGMSFLRNLINMKE